MIDHSVVTRWWPAVAVLSVIAAQNPAQQPAFQGRVDLVTLDVRVVDQRGTPVTSLGTTDFDVTVEGRPRQVVSAEYLSASGAQKSSVLMVVDRENLRVDTSRTTLDAAATFIERLPESHAAGLLLLPDGKSFDMGSGRAAMTGALRKMLGQYNPSFGKSVDEESIRASLHAAIGRMSARNGRRTIVYLTDRSLQSMHTVDLVRRAALSKVVFYVISADSPIISAESLSSATGDEARDGLAALAEGSGGAMLRRIAGGDTVFNRLALELSGQYLLAFAADPSADTGVHSIRVRVKQPGADVHAQRQFVR